MSAIEEVGEEVRTRALCDSLGVVRATLYRHRRGESVPREKQPRPRHPRALLPDEREAVLGILHCDDFADHSPAEVHATLLEQGRYLCSERTMYRLLTASGEVRERRDQLRHPQYHKPELLATAPNQVWSWDITKLKGPAKWSYFYLYVLLDIFSRYVVGWMAAESESAVLAQRLIEETCAKQQIQEGQLILHADRGSPMTSKSLALFLADLGIDKTHSRPHVSNDNPYSEAHFKTLKYRPEFPDRFGSVQHVRAVGRPLFDWYNNEHHHSALAWLTPAVVHYGRTNEVLDVRYRTRLAAYAEHPERFVRGEPRPETLVREVWINPPEKTTHQDAPESTQRRPDDPRVIPVCRTYEPSLNRGVKPLGPAAALSAAQ
jgi:putative transposase